MFGLSTFKLIGIGIGVLAVIGLFAMVMGWKSERDSLRVWQTEVLTATRDASANPKLGKEGVAEQVKLLGQAVKDLKGAIARQNSAIDILAKETTVAREAAAQASQKAEKRAGAASATAGRLNASARSSETQAKPCEPSKALKETWR